MRYGNKSLSDYLLSYKKAFLLLIVGYICFIVANIYMVSEIATFLKKTLILFVSILFVRIVVARSMEDLIALLILMLPFPLYITFGKDLGTSITLGIYLVGIVYIVKNMMSKEAIFAYRPLFPILMYITVCYILSFSNTPWMGRENALRNMSVFISCVIIFYLVVNSIKSNRALVRIIDIMTIMCFLEALLIIYQVLFPKYSGFINFFASRVTDVVEMYGDMASKRGIRVFGTIALDYGLMSTFFAMNLIIQFFRIQSLKQSAKRNLYILCMLFSGFALISIGTRGGFLSLFLAIMLTVLMTRRHIRVSRNIVRLAILLILLFGFMLFIAEYIPYTAKLYDRLVATEFNEGMPDTRARVWPLVWPIIMEHPWIGWGPQKIGKSGLIRYMSPHNVYLTYLFNIGFIGTVGILIFFGAVFRVGMKALRQMVDKEIIYVMVGLLGAFTVFIIDGMLVEYLRSTTMQQYVWIVFALIIAAASLAGNETGDAQIQSP